MVRALAVLIFIGCVPLVVILLFVPVLWTASLLGDGSAAEQCPNPAGVYRTVLSEGTQCKAASDLAPPATSAAPAPAAVTCIRPYCVHGRLVVTLDRAPRRM